MVRIYFTMAAVIFAGITNMLFTKTKLYKANNRPIDNYRSAWDGKRILGDNKTWTGFFSMVFFCVFFQVLLGLFCHIFSLEQYNDLFCCNDNTLGLNIVFGALVGFAYMLCELPNSFIKRRLNISAGKTGNGLLGFVFFIIDQTDSMLGVMLVLALFTDIGAWGYWQYVLYGMLMHVAINAILLLLKVRKNI